MIVERSKLLSHLSHVHCGGQLGEVLFSGQFECAAISHDQQLMVCTSGMDGVEPLAEPVGVIDLGLLIRTLKTFGEDDNDKLSVEFSHGRIEIEEEGRGRVRLVTGSASTIPTAMNDDIRDEVLSSLDYSTGIALPQSMVEAVIKAVGLLKATLVKVTRSVKKLPEGGTWFRVGEENANHADVFLPRAKPAKAADAYELLLDADKLVSVLSQIDDFTATQIIFTGVDSLVAVWDGEITYIISPQEAD